MTGKRFKEDMKVENSICVNNLKEATLEAPKAYIYQHFSIFLPGNFIFLYFLFKFPESL